jgi:serine-type D-Ala-D-Ala carboxypeptidase (penicillin-binding protein 5/6)
MRPRAAAAWLDRFVAISGAGRRNRGRVRFLTGGLAALLAAAAVSLCAPAPSFAQPSAAPAAPAVAVSGGALEDAGTGALLWSRGLDARRPMASITKVMTALVVLRAGGLSRRITVTPAAIAYARRNSASTAGLVAGDVLTAQQLLEGMLLPSGADAAYLLASAYGPGTAAFIGRMNALAKAIGMTSTHFSDFAGLPVPTESSTYSTPADLIRLAQRAMARPVFRQIVAQRSYLLPAGPGHRRYLWVQTDKLVGSYAGAAGIKTGYTHGAGTCLLFEATRGRRTLIGVVLHASVTYTPPAAVADAERLLNWGFTQP